MDCAIVLYLAQDTGACQKAEDGIKNLRVMSQKIYDLFWMLGADSEEDGLTCTTKIIFVSVESVIRVHCFEGVLADAQNAFRKMS